MPTTLQKSHILQIWQKSQKKPKRQTESLTQNLFKKSQISHIWRQKSQSGNPGVHAPCQNSLNTHSKAPSEQKNKLRKFFWLKFLKNLLMFLVYVQCSSKCASSLYTAAPCFEVRIFNQQKNLKTHNERNRDKLFIVIKPQILKNYVLEKENLQHFPLCNEFSRQL